MLDGDQRALLESAFDDLCSEATSDHYCGEGGCTIDTPFCSVMCARAARRKIEAVLDPVVRSTRPDRLAHGHAERVFFDKWTKDNARDSAVNGGFTLLEWILCPADQKVPDRPTQRDADVATAVIQWLGTNCGLCFVQECERRIREERAEYAEFDFDLCLNATPVGRDFFTQVLDKVLNDMIPRPADFTSSPDYNRKIVWQHTPMSLSHFRAQLRGLMTMLFTVYCVESGEASLNDVVDNEYQRKRIKRLQSLCRRAAENRVELLRKKRSQGAASA
jgi:hypothetical protein